jgi:hypothetical protein
MFIAEIQTGQGFQPSNAQLVVHLIDPYCGAYYCAERLAETGFCSIQTQLYESAQKVATPMMLR